MKKNTKNTKNTFHLLKTLKKTKEPKEPKEPKELKVMEVKLVDQTRIKDNSIKVSVYVLNGILFIKPQGYGDKMSVEGEGIPIVIELFDNDVRVVLWDDINEEGSSHCINLKKAKEGNRK